VRIKPRPGVVIGGAHHSAEKVASR
jgi:hypothetical protein